MKTGSSHYDTGVNIAAIKAVVDQDSQFSVNDITCSALCRKAACKQMPAAKICDGWVPHLLSSEQKKQRLKCAENV